MNLIEYVEIKYFVSNQKHARLAKGYFENFVMQDRDYAQFNSVVS